MSSWINAEADEWNCAARHTRSRSSVERTLRRRLERELLGQLSPAEYNVLSFIFGRTLGWTKYAEAIPYQHFLVGIREDHVLKRDDYGLPYASGCGVHSADTIRRALHSLLQRDLISRFDQASGFVGYGFMPASRARMAFLISGFGGRVPQTYRNFIRDDIAVLDNIGCIVVDWFPQYVNLVQVHDDNSFGKEIQMPIGRFNLLPRRQHNALLASSHGRNEQPPRRVSR